MFNERVDRLICRLIGLPERLQEVGIITKPSFPLNKVEEHTAVEELQGVIVRPLLVVGPIRQIILQALENRLVAFEEARLLTASTSKALS